MREYRFRMAHFEDHAGPGGLVRRALTERCIQRMLDCLTNCNADVERTYALPPFYSRGLRYEQEPAGKVEWWLDSVELARAKEGDCEDLACSLAGSLRASGVDARARLMGIGGDLYHVVVDTPKGILDPSVELGMQTPPGIDPRTLSVRRRRR